MAALASTTATLSSFSLRLPPSSSRVSLASAKFPFSNNVNPLKFNWSTTIFAPILHQTSPRRSLTIVSAKGYKMKTHKASAKRFRVTGAGKIVRRRAGKQHLLYKKSKKRKLRLSKMTLVDRSDYDNVIGALPYLKVNRKASFLSRKKKQKSDINVSANSSDESSPDAVIANSSDESSPDAVIANSSNESSPV